MSSRSLLSDAARTTRLALETLESRTLLSGDGIAPVLYDTVDVGPSPIDDIVETDLSQPGDANHDGKVDMEDFRVLAAAFGDQGDWIDGDFDLDGTIDFADFLILAENFGESNATYETVDNNLSTLAAAKTTMWPDQILLPPGFESEGIEAGRGQDFFLGGISWSGVQGSAGSIYKGNFRTGEGQILVPAPATNPERGLAGLSYDTRTDYIYAANGDPGAFAGSFTNQGVIIYDASSGALVEEIIIGDNILTNDVLVTNKAVYVTDSINPALYKIPLERGGRPNSAGLEKIDLQNFDMVPGFNANGLVGEFDGKELVVVNASSGVLYKVDTESGVSTAIVVQGAQNTFASGDGLYMDGRTLYIMQNQFGIGGPGKIAVVQLSGDLTQGTFVKDIVSSDFAVPTTITGFGDSIYAINSQFFDVDFGIQTDVVKVDK